MTDLRHFLEAIRKALPHRPSKDLEPGDVVLLNKQIEQALLDGTPPPWDGLGADPEIDPRPSSGWWN